MHLLLYGAVENNTDIKKRYDRLLKIRIQRFSFNCMGRTLLLGNYSCITLLHAIHGFMQEVRPQRMEESRATHGERLPRAPKVDALGDAGSSGRVLGG